MQRAARSEIVGFLENDRHDETVPDWRVLPYSRLGASGRIWPACGVHCYAVGVIKAKNEWQGDIQLRTLPDEVVYLTGRPVAALNAWLDAARIDKGSVFRAIDRWGNVSRRTLDPKSVNDIVKQRAALAGLEPGEFSAHGLRSGYLTEAANRGIPLVEAMEQSRHRSVQQASSYYNNATRRSGRAARML